MAITLDNPSKSNYLENVAIVGAGGRSGIHMIDALLSKKKHQITAITRPDSTHPIPPGIHHITKVDFNDSAALVEALEGQDILIITLAVRAPKETQTQLIDAAVKAGINWIMPNEWGTDFSNEEVIKDSGIRDRGPIETRAYIERIGAGKTQWIGLCCGFWYEFSLAGTEARYGFDFEKKKVTFFDDGKTQINTSTWPQVGRAVANLLSLKVSPEGKQDEDICLSQYANKSVHVSSFFISQREMFQSVLRVTGEHENDWEITYEKALDRFHRGQQLAKEGQLAGLGIILYTRVFYKDGAGDYNRKLDNVKLQLPTESLDDATRLGVQMVMDGITNAIV